VQWFSRVVTLVRTSLESLRNAQDGLISMTPQLKEVLLSISVGKVPAAWLWTTTGDEVSWQSQSVAHWMQGAIDVRGSMSLHVAARRCMCSVRSPGVCVVPLRRQRHEQLKGWLARGPPVVFWLPGLFNPQGFLSAVRQDVCRYGKLALDDLTLFCQVCGWTCL
jgi:dynein heavy chain